MQLWLVTRAHSRVKKPLGSSFHDMALRWTFYRLFSIGFIEAFYGCSDNIPIVY